MASWWGENPPAKQEKWEDSSSGSSPPGMHLRQLEPCQQEIPALHFLRSCLRLSQVWSKFILSPDQHEAVNLQDTQTSFLFLASWNHGQSDVGGLTIRLIFSRMAGSSLSSSFCSSSPAPLDCIHIVASLAPAASVVLTSFVINFKHTCEPQDNGVSVCLHSGFHSGRVLTHFPGSTNRWAQDSRCLTWRWQFSAGTKDAGSQWWLKGDSHQLCFSPISSSHNYMKASSLCWSLQDARLCSLLWAAMLWDITMCFVNLPRAMNIACYHHENATESFKLHKLLGLKF